MELEADLASPAGVLGDQGWEVQPSPVPGGEDHVQEMVSFTLRPQPLPSSVPASNSNKTSYSRMRLEPDIAALVSL